MKTLRIGLLLLIPLGMLGCSRLHEFSIGKERKAVYGFTGIDQIAIVDVVGDVHSEVVKNQVSDFFTDQLLKKGYGPVVRDYVQHELDNRAFDHANMTLEAYAIEAGRAIEVPAVLIISVPTFGEEMSMTAKLIDVETGSALWYGHASNREKKRKTGRWFGRSKDTGYTDFDAEYAALMGSTEEPVFELTEEELLEVALTLQDERRVLSLVSQICRDLPPRLDPAPDPLAPQPNPWRMAAAPAASDYLPIQPPAQAPLFVPPPARPNVMPARMEARPPQFLREPAYTRAPEYVEPEFMEPEYMTVTPPQPPAPVAVAPTPRPAPAAPMESPTVIPEPVPMYAPVPLYAPTPPLAAVRTAPPLQPLIDIAPARRIMPQPGLSQIDPLSRPRRDTVLDLAPPRVVPQVEPQTRPVIQPRLQPEVQQKVEPKKKKKKFHWTDLL